MKKPPDKIAVIPNVQVEEGLSQEGGFTASHLPHLLKGPFRMIPSVLPAFLMELESMMANCESCLGPIFSLTLQDLCYTYLLSLILDFFGGGGGGLNLLSSGL